MSTSILLQLDNGQEITISIEKDSKGHIDILANNNPIGAICTDGSCLMFPDIKVKLSLQ